MAERYGGFFAIAQNDGERQNGGLYVFEIGDSSKAGQVCPSQNDEERQNGGLYVFEIGDSS